MAKHILIVNSEVTIREFIATMLNSVGYECGGAASAEEALAVLEKERFDLMITNLLLPAMNGDDLMQRTLQLYPKMRVIFATTVSNPEVIIQSFVHGVSHYVITPCVREQMVSAVQTVLEKPGVGGPR